MPWKYYQKNPWLQFFWTYNLKSKPPEQLYGIRNYWLIMYQKVAGDKNLIEFWSQAQVFQKNLKIQLEKFFWKKLLRHCEWIMYWKVARKQKLVKFSGFERGCSTQLQHVWLFRALIFKETQNWAFWGGCLLCWNLDTWIASQSDISSVHWQNLIWIKMSTNLILI